MKTIQSFLKNVIKPPFVIFYKGNIDLLNENKLKISVIGSRDNSEYGRQMCQQIVEGFSKKRCNHCKWFC